MRKFRSVADMPGPPPLPPLDPENLRVLVGLTDVAYGFRPWHLTPGVRKFRSLEEANLHRSARDRELILESRRP